MAALDQTITQGEFDQGMEELFMFIETLDGYPLALYPGRLKKDSHRLIKRSLFNGRDLA